MKRTLAIAALLASGMLVSGCVTTSEFERYKAEMAAEIQKSRQAEDVLFCESKVDAYQDMLNSDEPDPTRRDEPDGTRRDLAACEAEFDDVAGANVGQCNTQMEACTSGNTHPNQKCRSCFTECLKTGNWPTTGFPSCP